MYSFVRLTLFLFIPTIVCVTAYAEVIEAHYPSRDMADRAVISFHSELLEAHHDKSYLILDLDASQQSALIQWGFYIAPAIQYIEQQAKLANERAIGAFQSSLQASANATTQSGIVGFECYPTVEETYDQVQVLADSYPALTEWFSIGQSFHAANPSGSDGYDLNVLKITSSATDNLYPDKPILFIHAAMHAREYATAPLALAFAEQLLGEYGSDADIHWILNRHEVQLLFYMNPDGRKIAEVAATNNKRKNDNPNFCGPDAVTRGVDLNRNFSFLWAAAAGTPGVRSSYDACNETFRGPAPASEVETQAVEAHIRSIFADNRGPNIDDAAPATTPGIHIDIHSFGQLILWPWAHAFNQAPNGEQLTTLGRKLAYFNGYKPQQAIGLYPLDGSSESVSYGELGVAHFTFEIGGRFHQECQTFERAVLAGDLPALLYAAKVVAAPYLLPQGPDVDQFAIKGNIHPDITQGTAFSVTATIDDGLYSSRNGVEPTQSIASVAYAVDRHIADPLATVVSLGEEAAADGLFDSASEPVTIAFNSTDFALGQHTLYLQAQDAANNWGPVSARHFTVIDTRYLAARITVDCNGNDCRFSSAESNDTDGEIIAFNWQFGDGTASTDANPVHFYTANGSFDVQLTVTGADGEQAVDNQQVVVNLAGLPPQAVMSYQCDGLSCQFDGLGSSDPDDGVGFYYWDFGDGQSASGASETHRFDKAGSYSVTLFVLDYSGWIIPTQQTVTVAPAASVAAATQTTQPSQNNRSGGGGSTSWFTLLAMLFAVLFRLTDPRRKPLLLSPC